MLRSSSTALPALGRHARSAPSSARSRPGVSRSFCSAAAAAAATRWVTTRLPDGRERDTDVFSSLLSERVMILSGAVTDDVASLACAQLLFLEAEDPTKPVDLYINSPGGSVVAGLAIYDTMQYVTCPVRTLVLGQASSMGAVLLAAGAHGHRTALPHARVMLHQPSGGIDGTAEDMRIHAEEIIKTRARLNQILAKHTGQTPDAIDQAVRHDLFLTPAEALEFGLVDRIMARRGESPIVRMPKTSS